jgi:hypothetical protein
MRPPARAASTHERVIEDVLAARSGPPIRRGIAATVGFLSVFFGHAASFDLEPRGDPLRGSPMLAVATR